MARELAPSHLKQAEALKWLTAEISAGRVAPISIEEDSESSEDSEYSE